MATNRVSSRAPWRRADATVHFMPIFGQQFAFVVGLHKDTTNIGQQYVRDIALRSRHSYQAVRISQQDQRGAVKVGPEHRRATSNKNKR